MRIAVLSQDPGLYSTRRLCEAGRQYGHEMSVIDYLRCRIALGQDGPALLLGDRPAETADAAVPRIAASRTYHGTAVVRQLEAMGVRVVNGSRAIARSRDKLRCLQILALEGLPIPRTGFLHSSQEAGPLIWGAGGPPLVIKMVEGTQGVGVALAENEPAARSVIEAFRDRDLDILVQEFVEEAGGSDVRALVVGDRVVASMMRQAPPGEFRSNLHRGGTAAPVELAPEEREAAVRAARALGLNFAGVDLLRSRRGPLVLEVNSSPGLEGIEQVSGVDVAGAVIEWVGRPAPEVESPTPESNPGDPRDA